MRKTKIVCTIGPASDNETVLKRLMLAGMNTARINFSHGSFKEQEDKINKIKKVREELNLQVSLLLDTKGPEVRIGKFEDGEIFLNPGDTFSLTAEDIIGDKYEFSISKDSITNEYTVNYEKNINEENLLCSAKVVYDMSQSRLSIKIQSYRDKTGQKFESYKDCYSLANNDKALRINILQGDTNNRSIYVIDTYKEIINFKTKVASCNALSGDLLVGEINENTFISSSSTDNCGFILEYDADTQNPAINTFGDLTKW